MTTFALTAHDWDQATGPCCGVLACAIAAQKPFKDVWAWFKKTDKCYASPRWKGTTYHKDYPKWFKFAGIKTERKDASCKLTKFVNLYTKKDTAYFVRTTRHAQIVYNDKVRDQSGTHHINDYWGKNKFVREFYEIPMTNENPFAWQEFGLPLFDYKGGK